MTYAVEACKVTSDRASYKTTNINSTSLSVTMPYGTVNYSGTIALRPLSAACGSCDGVLIVEFDTGIQTGAYWVNGRSIIALENVQLQQRKYLVSYFAGKNLYWAAAQFANTCGSCGCSDCEYIWDVSATSDTWESLASTESNVPGYEEAIPLAFQASQLPSSSVPCDDDIEYLDFDQDLKAVS